MYVVAVELFEQPQPTDAGHSNVEQQAAGPRIVEGVKKMLRRFVGFRLETHRTHLHGKRLADGRIVIDNKDGWL